MPPITGTLQADFSSFFEACQKAEVGLKSFETESRKVEKSLNTMTDSFSGRRVIQEATLMSEAIERSGGATRLTASELQAAGRKAEEAAQKMKALGLDVPTNLQKLADAATAARDQTDNFTGAFTRLTSAFTAASLIERGVTAVISFGIEGFRSAAQIADLASKTGLSSDAIQKMGFVAEQTGGSLETFTSAAFKLSAKLAGGGDSVSAALNEIGLSLASLRAMTPEDQFERVVDALGKVEGEGERARVGIELFGKSFEQMAGAINQGYEDIAKGATLMSRETVAAADRFDDGWSKSLTFLKALTAESLAFSAEPFIKAAEAIGLLGKESTKAKGDIELAGDTYEDWAGRLSAAHDVVDKLTRAQLTQISVAKQMGATSDQLMHDFGLTEDALRILDERIREVEKAEAAAAQTSNTLGDSQQNLGKAFDTAGGAAKTYGDKLNTAKTQTDELAKSSAIARANTEALAKALQEQDKSLDETAKREKQRQDENDAFMTAPTLNDRQALTVSSDLPVLTGAALDDAIRQGSAFTAGGSGVGTTSQADALRNLLRLLEAKEGRYAPKNNTEFFAMQREVTLLAQLRQLQGSGKIPGFANGVENFPGGLAYVHKGEALVNLPPGTDVIPAGRRGGGVAINLGGIHFHGTTIGTSGEFRRQVQDAMTEVARTSGARWSFR